MDPSDRDLHAAEALRAVLDGKTKPVGSLGRLEDMAVKLARVLGRTSGRLDADLTIFAADHGIAAEGVSAFPQAVTGQMVANFLAGGAAANVIAAQLGIAVNVVDCGIVSPMHAAAGLLDLRLGAGTANSRHGPAMTPAVAARAIAQGRAYGAASAAALACFGEMGIANTSAATLIAHKLCGLPIADLVGRGTGLDDARLRHKQSVLEHAAARTGTLAPTEVLAEYGGFEIGTMAGAMIGAAAAGRVVVVDGFIATAAAALARAIEPACEDHLIFAHRSAEAGHAALVNWLGVTPLLDLDMRLGEGTGALLAVPLLRAAFVLFGMASFAEAGVSQRSSAC